MLTMMMAPGGGFVAIHRPVPPMAYLDHCALRKFSEDAKLGPRLTSALHARNGTLAISWLNLGEYATVTDPGQRRAVEQFLDGILPGIFCIDVDPAVMDREGGSQPFPYADQAVANLFFSGHKQTVRLFTAAKLFEPLNHPLLIDSKERLAGKVRPRLEALRAEYAASPTFRAQVRKADSTVGTVAPSRTRAIFRTVAGMFFPDPTSPLQDNDVLDFLHTMIPVSYCDAVLLDGGAWDRVERARRKLRRAGVEIAESFPMRGDGIERFLEYLERA